MVVVLVLPCLNGDVCHSLLNRVTLVFFASSSIKMDNFSLLLAPITFIIVILSMAFKPTSHRVPLLRVFVAVMFSGIVSLGLIPLLRKEENLMNFSIEFFNGKPFYNYWNVTSFTFDHPEPNFRVCSHIAEFWSVLTTIPFSG